jgi:DNA processing protein
MNIENETKFYNALNILNQGDYSALTKLKQNYSTWAESWKQSLNDKEGQMAKIDPDKSWQELEKRNIKLILQEDAGYPPLLKEIHCAPYGLYVLGEIPLGPAIAIVGTRKATDYGKKSAKWLAEELVKYNLIIVSGLALGIDAVAHESCLAVSGKTIAVLGTSLDNIYPRTNIRLSEKILKNGGAIVSEYPLGTPALPYNFPRRNRIISGLSLGTIVVEAPRRSGALITSEFALNQNGAKLITSIEDVLEEIGIAKIAQPENFDDENQRKIFEVFQDNKKPLTAEEIAEITNFSISEINQSLTLLLMRELIKENNGKYYL